MDACFSLLFFYVSFLFVDEFKEMTCNLFWKKKVLYLTGIEIKRIFNEYVKEKSDCVVHGKAIHIVDDDWEVADGNE